MGLGKKISFSVFLVALALLLAEGALRLWGDFLIAKRRPDADAKLPGEIRVVSIGDSFTFGVGAAAESSYPAALEHRLQDKLKGHKVRCINLGVPGSNAREAMSVLRANGSSYQPDLILLLVGLGERAKPSDPERARRGGQVEGSLEKRQDHEISPVRLFQVLRMALSATGLHQAQANPHPPETTRRLAPAIKTRASELLKRAESLSLLPEAERAEAREKIIEDLEESGALESLQAWVQLQAGKILLLTGQGEDARLHFLRASEIAPRWREPALQLDRLASQGRNSDVPPEADARRLALELALREVPPDRPEETIDLGQKLLALDSCHWVAWGEVGMAARAIGDFSRAAEALEKACAMNASDPQCNCALAYALRGLAGPIPPEKPDPRLRRAVELLGDLADQDPLPAEYLVNLVEELWGLLANDLEGKRGLETALAQLKDKQGLVPGPLCDPDEMALSLRISQWLRLFAEQSGSGQWRLVFLTYPLLEPRDQFMLRETREINEGISLVAREKNVPLIDLEMLLRRAARKSPTVRLWTRDWHPTTEGYALMAEKMAEELVPLLPKE